MKKGARKERIALAKILNGGRFFGFHTRIIWNDKTNGIIQTADGAGTFPIKASKSSASYKSLYCAWRMLDYRKKASRKILNTLISTKLLFHVQEIQVVHSWKA